MAQLVVWKTPAEAKKKLASRLKAAKEYRKRVVEDQWLANEKYAYGSSEEADLRRQLQQLASDTEDFDVGESIEVSYAFRALRFIHAQWSANPPVSTARPQSPDLEDRRAARAADHVMKWSLRRFQLQEKYDLAGLDCMVYGTGITYTGWNASLGDILEFDPANGRLLMDGDIEVRLVSPWDFFVDPAARTWADVRYVFERITLSEEEARSKFPDKWHLFRRYKKKSERHTIAAPSEGGIEIRPEESTDELFDIYAYWEPGLPENGFLGRHCLCFEDGVLITPPAENPNMVHPAPSLDERRAFREGSGELPERRPGKAKLPFHIVTDIDVPGQVWGRSALEYAGPAQNLLKNIDSATLEAAKVHGVVRMILPPGAKLASDPSNSNVDVIEMESEGSGEVKYMQPPGLPAVMTELRATMRLGIDDMFGLNEASFGQASRETSGFQMQYAVNQSNLIRRRLFNKAVAFVESMYKGILALGVLHWDAEKTLRILGQEDAFDMMALKGIDIDGGFEIETEYGTSLPLDPTARREELLKYMPLYEKAGIPPRRLLANIGLAELEATQSLPDLARNRMQEAIDRMIAGEYVTPRKFQDHEGMLAYALEYVMLAPYQALPEATKGLIERHIEERRQLAAQETAPAAPAGAPPPGLPPGLAGPEAAPPAPPLAPPM